MLCAAIGHIRGNWPALRAVLQELDDEGIQTIVNTGDCVGDVLWPNEVIQCLKDRNTPTVQGHTDRLVLRAHRKKATLQAKMSPLEVQNLVASHDACTSGNIEFLRGLPRNLTLVVDGVRIALCHGTWTSQTKLLSADDPDSLFERMREMVESDVFIFGNGRAPHDRLINKTLFVNPGCVHDPDRNVAQYAVISTEQSPWSVEYREVAYTAEAAPTAS